MIKATKANPRTFSPFLAATAVAVARRHKCVNPKAKTSLVMSYFAATRSNIAATSLGFLVKDARDIFLFCQPHSFLPLVAGL